jgi:CheY-like chemotaxis protein
MYPQETEILVVVHEPERRERIGRLLADEGLAVTAATEGLAALRASRNRQFDLIVAATDLPGSLDGPATVRRARQRHPWVKALYTGDPSTRPASGNPDIDDFIAAPFERHELIGCIFELLHREAAAGIADLGRRVRTDLRVS